MPRTDAPISAPQNDCVHFYIGVIATSKLATRTTDENIFRKTTKTIGKKLTAWQAEKNGARSMGASQRHRGAAAASFPERTWNLSAALPPDEGTGIQYGGGRIYRYSTNNSANQKSPFGHVTEDDESGVLFLVSADRNLARGVVL